MKCVLYEEGVFGRIKAILEKENPDDHLACAAVLQNISEHRFLKGYYITIYFITIYYIL